MILGNKMTKKKYEVSIHSSAAECLTYIAAVGDMDESMEMRYEDENIWRQRAYWIGNYSEIPNSSNRRIVSLYFDYAELQAERQIPMSMEDWAK